MVVIRPFGTKLNCFRPVTGTVLHEYKAAVRNVIDIRIFFFISDNLFMKVAISAYNNNPPKMGFWGIGGLIFLDLNISLVALL
jgi:hypothetical protein